MNENQAILRVHEVSDLSVSDPEAASDCEYGLFVQILRELADLNPEIPNDISDLVLSARQALRCTTMPFDRW